MHVTAAAARWAETSYLSARKGPRRSAGLRSVFCIFSLFWLEVTDPVSVLRGNVYRARGALSWYSNPSISGDPSYPTNSTTLIKQLYARANISSVSGMRPMCQC